MHQQLWGYKVDEKLYVGVREQKGLNTAGPSGLSGTQYIPVIMKTNQPNFATDVYEWL